MKRSTSLLSRLDWRQGRGSSASRVPEGMTRGELEDALADLPSDIHPDELLEFIEADGESACPVFKERLRALLWGWTGQQGQLASVRRVSRLLN